MNRALPRLQMQIHQVDGASAIYGVLGCAAVKKLLDDFQPAQIFSRPRLVISDSYSLASLPVAKITRLDLVAEPPVRLMFPVGIVQAVELTRTEFAALIRQPIEPEPWQPWTEAAVMYLDLKMADHQRLLLAMETRIDPFAPARHQSGLCFRMRNGGISVLNLSHLVRRARYPRIEPPPVPVGAADEHWQLPAGQF